MHRKVQWWARAAGINAMSFRVPNNEIKSSLKSEWWRYHTMVSRYPSRQKFMVENIAKHNLCHEEIGFLFLRNKTHQRFLKAVLWTFSKGRDFAKQRFVLEHTSFYFFFFSSAYIPLYFTFSWLLFLVYCSFRGNHEGWEASCVIFLRWKMRAV